MNTCRNCDKRIQLGCVYCSNVCEDMDKHPAPRDDMERFTMPAIGVERSRRAHPSAQSRYPSNRPLQEPRPID